MTGNDLDVREVAEETYRIQVNPPKTLGGYTVYFIRSAAGVVIDPGPSANVPFIQAAMRYLGMNDLSYLIPTHIHMDHAGSLGSLAELYPGARVLLHPLAIGHALDPSRVIRGTKRVYGDDFERHYGPIMQVAANQALVAVEGERYVVGDRELQVVFSPGHSDDHVAVLDLRTRGLFCGEALGARTKSAPSSPLPNASPPQFDMERYIESIGKLSALKPTILMYAHDGVVREPERSLFAATVENTRRVGEVVAKFMAEGRSVAGIIDGVAQTVLAPMGIRREENDLWLTVSGYHHYLAKNRASLR